MPDSTHYEVYTDFLYRDRGFTRGIEESERNVRQMTRSVSALQSGLEGAATRLMNYGKYMAAAAAGIAVYGGYRVLTEDLIGYNAQLEQMRIGIGGAVSSMVKWDAAKDQADNFTYALGFADDAVQKLRDDAKASVGTTQDFVGAFNMLAGPIANTGLARTDQQLMEITRDFTRLGVAAGGALLGGNSQQAVADLMRMLSGAAGAEQQLARIFGLVGDEAARFNRLDPAKRYQEIYEKLVLLRPAVDQYGKSWEGVTSTLKDTFEIYLGKAGAPLFEDVKSAIADLNAWLEKNEEQISQLADVYGNKLAGGMNSFISTLEGSNETLNQIYDISGALVDNFDPIIAGYEGLSSVIGGMIQRFNDLIPIQSEHVNLLLEAVKLVPGVGQLASVVDMTYENYKNRQQERQDSALNESIAQEKTMRNAYNWVENKRPEIKQQYEWIVNQTGATMDEGSVFNELANKITTSWDTFQTASLDVFKKSPDIRAELEENFKRTQYELLLNAGVNFEDAGLLMSYIPDTATTEAAREIKSMSDRAGKVVKTKKIKLPKKIEQKFGPVTIHQHIARAEPDRVAISTRQALGRAGVVRMSGLRNIMSK